MRSVSSFVLIFVEIPWLLRICPTSDKFDTFIERLWTQRYNTTGHYALHYDWAFANKQSRRESTFMVYLQADCKGGGTNFPMLDAPYNQKWCDFVDCDEPYDHGVTFRPVVGNAVFWQNLYEDGRGDQRTLHAGLPVTSGWKIGMNIWTRQGPLSEDIRGVDI